MLSLKIGATGMQAQQTNVDVIANNIANMTTTGYKRQRPQFQDLLYQNDERPGSISSDTGQVVPSGIQKGVGVRPTAIKRLHEQGAIQITDNQLDVALNGDGFFQIELPDGEIAYTRDGGLQVNENGEIVTGRGNLLEPNIVIPDDAIDIEINENGEVFAAIDGQTDLQNLGQIELATFINPSGLNAIGNNLLLETQASGPPITGTPGEDNFAVLLQGALEASNVEAVDEITNLITAQRSYEMNSNVISTSDEMMQNVNQLR